MTTINNLPKQSAAFLGRAGELAEIAALLAKPGCHLLTLVGPGGIGKTRLVIKATFVTNSCDWRAVYSGQMSVSEQSMKSKIGLWIDHRQTVIVRIFETGEETSRIISKLPKRVRFSGVSYDRSDTNPHDDTSEYRRERRFQELRNRYYDEVIAKLADFDSIFIMGPGEAKIELQKRLENERQAVLVIEAADKMTENQIAAKVRQHFQEAEQHLGKDR